MSKNSFHEINFLKNKVSEKLAYVNIQYHIIINKNKRNFSKIIFYLKNKILFFLKFLPEKNYWNFFIEFIMQIFFNSRLRRKFVETSLRELIEFMLKFFPIKEFEKILIIGFKKAEKQVFKKIDVLNFYYLKISFFESKGNLFISKKSKKKEEDENFFYNSFPEQFQIHNEYIRINLDFLDNSIPKIIINEIIKKKFSNKILYPTTICFFESIIRILTNSNYQQNSIAKLHAIRIKNLFKSNIQYDSNSIEFFLIFYHSLGEINFPGYQKLFELLIIIFFRNNMFFEINFLKNLNFLKKQNLLIFKNLIFFEINENFKFSKFNLGNIKKYIKAKLIKNYLIIFSKLTFSISFSIIKKILCADIVDIFYWINELNQQKKICATIDCLKGILYFYKF
jgi:hypothetical protein